MLFLGRNKRPRHRREWACPWLVGAGDCGYFIIFSSLVKNPQIKINQTKRSERLDTIILCANFPERGEMVIKDKNIKTMKHFRKWAENKNQFLAGVSLLIACFAEPYFKLSESVRKGKRIEGNIPLPSLKTWLKLYRNPKRIGKVLLSALETGSDDDAKEANILKIFSESASQLQNNAAKIQNELKKLTQDEWTVIRENSTKMMEEFKELAINNCVKGSDKKENENFAMNLKKPEFIFFIRVMAPCFSLYGTYPLELLKQAQNGNDDALEKLIRLDKSIIFEPTISEIIHKAQTLKKQERMSRIKKAFRSSPKVNIKMKAIKCHLGGLISYLSEAMKQKITAADIRRLYDALAHDMNDDAVDHDLYKMTEETFSKNIQNAREMWQIILPEK